MFVVHIKIVLKKHFYVNRNAYSSMQLSDKD